MPGSDKEDECQDLTGNNDEWEKLLENLTQEDEGNSSAYMNEKNLEAKLGRREQLMPLKEAPQPMKQAKSFIKLVLPSADNIYACEPEVGRFSALKPKVTTQHSRYFQKENFSPNHAREVPTVGSIMKNNTESNFSNWSREGEKPSRVKAWLPLKAGQSTEKPSTFSKSVESNTMEYEDERCSSPCKGTDSKHILNYYMIITQIRSIKPFYKFLFVHICHIT